MEYVRPAGAVLGAAAERDPDEAAPEGHQQPPVDPVQDQTQDPPAVARGAPGDKKYTSFKYIYALYICIEYKYTINIYTFNLMYYLFMYIYI